MKYIISGNGNECELFSSKHEAGEFLMQHGYGQSENFDLRDFSAVGLFNSVKYQRIGMNFYWYAEEVPDESASQRFAEICDGNSRH